MRKAAFGVIQGAVTVLSLSSVAYGQQPIPCKYFPLVEKASADSSGGLIILQVRSDPAQFEQGKQAEYSARCELALATPAPWLTVVEQTPLDSRGYSTVTLRADPNDVPVERTAVLTVGTPRTVYRGAAPHPANTTVTIGQSEVVHPAAVPVVNSGGIVNNASSLRPVSPGSLISIYGSNLSSGINTFSIPFPLNFNGTSVSVSGIFCPLLYVSPTLINAQLPTNSPTGTVTVTVTVNGVSGSNTATVSAAAPGIFMFGGGDEAIVQHSNGSNVTTSSPAVAGENLAFYGTGIGPLNPPLVTGEVAGGAGNLSMAATSCGVQVNGVSAQFSYCGMTPGLVGLAQVNFTMPATLPQGLSTLTWVVDGVASMATQFPSTGGGGAPTINSFTANPTSITAGQSATLSWNISNASAVNINNSGPLAAVSGEYVVTPSATATYTITASNSAGSVSASVTVIVNSSPPPGPFISFSVSPATISAGQSATLSWSVTNAASVSINNGIGSVAVAGTHTVSPTSTTTYTLTAINSAGASASSSATLTVTAPLGNVTLVFTNDLIYPATVSVNGTPVGTVAASSTQQVTLPSQPTINVTYDVVGHTNSGTAIGDPISGYFNPLSSPTGTMDFSITNYFANTNTYYFAPVITNTSGTTLEMVVNYGLVAQNECNCSVQTGVGPTNIGYYLYYSNSNVAGFANGSNYTGSYRIFNPVTGIVANSGVVGLTFNIFP